MCRTYQFDEIESERTVRFSLVRSFARSIAVMSDEELNVTNSDEALASELAEKLEDPNGLSVYRKIAKGYDESYIRSILSQVLEVPLDRIRTTRGALFTWLINHHADRSKHTRSTSDSRD